MGVRVGVAISLLAATLSSGCTGGQEGTAAEEQIPSKNGVNAAAQPAAIDVRSELGSLSPAIPLYAGARYREDLTRRDAVMIRNQYGPAARVYTLATDDSFPQVFHYYTTYLAQFRAFPSTNPYPNERENWRTLEVPLHTAMQDPFIPGEAFRADKQVILQVAETEAEPRTVIRYIVAPVGTPIAVAASTPGQAQPAMPEAAGPTGPPAEPAVAR